MALVDGLLLNWKLYMAPEKQPMHRSNYSSPLCGPKESWVRSAKARKVRTWNKRVTLFYFLWGQSSRNNNNNAFNSYSVFRFNQRYFNNILKNHLKSYTIKTIITYTITHYKQFWRSRFWFVIWKCKGQCSPGWVWAKSSRGRGKGGLWRGSATPRPLRGPMWDGQEVGISGAERVLHGALLTNIRSWPDVGCP